MPTLDDTYVTGQQVGDMSRGLQIRDMDATGGQAGAGATSGSDKGKEKELSDGPAPKAHS
jgi:hypothetical protein